MKIRFFIYVNVEKKHFFLKPNFLHNGNMYKSTFNRIRLYVLHLCEICMNTTFKEKRSVQYYLN